MIKINPVKLPYQHANGSYITLSLKLFSQVANYGFGLGSYFVNRVPIIPPIVRGSVFYSFWYRETNDQSK